MSIARRFLPHLIPLAVLLVGGCHQAARSASADPPAALTPPPFDGDRAYQALEDQCAMGPRVPGTTAHAKCLQYIVDNLKPNVDKVLLQTFPYDDPDRKAHLTLTNVIGVINPDAPRKILIFTHWDTRPTADQEIDPTDRKKPIAGADDGASGTGLQLELARQLHMQRPAVGVILMFVDGEDWGPGEDRMYLGARWYAKHPIPSTPAYGILLDMIGPKDVRIYREQTSDTLHKDIDDKIWNTAASLGYGSYFPNSVKYTIGDDHTPVNDAGIPAVDLIDFDYPYWHTLQDTPDKCSPRSLQVVGQVMLQLLRGEPANR